MHRLPSRHTTTRSICWRCQIQHPLTRSFSATRRSEADEPASPRRDRSREAFSQISRLGADSQHQRIRAVDNAGQNAATRGRGTFRGTPRGNASRGGFSSTRGTRGSAGSFRASDRGSRGGRGGASRGADRGRARGRGARSTPPSRRRFGAGGGGGGDASEGTWMYDTVPMPTNAEILGEEHEAEFKDREEIRHYGQVLDFIDAFEARDDPEDLLGPSQELIEENHRRVERGEEVLRRLPEEEPLGVGEMREVLRGVTVDFGKGDAEMGKGGKEATTATYDVDNMSDRLVKETFEAYEKEERENVWDLGIRDAMNHVVATDERSIPRHDPRESDQDIAERGMIGDVPVGAGGGGNVIEDDLRYFARRVHDEWRDPKQLAQKLVRGDFVKFRNLPEKREVLKLAIEAGYQPGDEEKSESENPWFEELNADAKRAMVKRLVGGQYEDVKDRGIKGGYSSGVARLVGGNASYPSESKAMLLKTINEVMPEASQRQVSG